MADLHAEVAALKKRLFDEAERSLRATEEHLAEMQERWTRYTSEAQTAVDNAKVRLAAVVHAIGPKPEVPATAPPANG